MEEKMYFAVGNGGGGLVSSTTATAQTAQSVVEHELVCLGQETSNLIQIAEILQARLACVLLPEPESKEAGTPVDTLTALPSAIRVERMKVVRALQTLQSIISRIEL